VTPTVDAASDPIDRAAPDSGSVVDATAPAPDSSSTTKPVGCFDGLQAGHHVATCSGFKVDVEVSPACALGGCGLILDIHGLTMDADQEDRSTEFRSQGAARGYVVLQPTAGPSLLGPSWVPNVDDDKIWKAVEDARTAFAIDPKRIHVTGFSQGGAFTFRLVCKHANEIASVAPIAAADGQTLDSSLLPPYRLDCAFSATEQPSRPVPILHMHGAKDGILAIGKGRAQRDAIIAWLGPASTTKTVLHDDDGYTHTRYESASRGTVYEYIEHQYEAPPVAGSVIPVKGHCMPGGGDLQSTIQHPLVFSCAPPSEFVWSTLALDFFAAHTL
jgi:poly(3-hydroxybutyrate) depolymerase